MSTVAAATNRETREAVVRSDRREVRLAATITRPQLTTRAADGDEPAVLEVSGYASVFDSDSQVMGFWEPFVEQVKRGAFKRALAAGPDVRFLFNHDGIPLARSTNETLDLAEKPRGLWFRAELNPDMQAARDVHAAIERGDITQMSFAFTVEREAWDYTGDIDRRDILEVGELLDVSAVSYPAYEAASVEASGGSGRRSADTPQVEVSGGELPAAGDAGEQHGTDGPTESPARNVGRRARALTLLTETIGH